MSLKPLPPPQYPIAGNQSLALPPVQAYAEYLAALDQLLRSAPGFAGAVAADSNGAGHVLSVANFLAGCLLRSGPGGAFSDTTPNASDIVAAIPKAIIGTFRTLIFANAGGGLMTLLAGSSVTLQGNTTVAAGSGRLYLLTVTGATRGLETVSLRGLFTASM